MLRSMRPPVASRLQGAALVLTLVAFLVVVFMGALVIDGGLVYGRRAEIAKAVDAAAIAGISNIGRGQGTATQLARDMFHANYQMTNRDAWYPDVDVAFGEDANGNRTIDLRGTAYLRPLFLTIFPGFDVFRVHAASQATRAQLKIALSLDTSFSMQANSGCQTLPDAVETFADFFDDDRDWLSLNTFASVMTLDMPIREHFKGFVRRAIPWRCDQYVGYTFFSDGLDAAYQQNQVEVRNQTPTVLKVIVIFTDGMANTIQQELRDCAPGLWNVTAGDPGPAHSDDVYLLDPTTGAYTPHYSVNGGPIAGCTDLSSFPSVLPNVVRDLTGATAGDDIRAEARVRSLLTATKARQAGNVIYTIGLGNQIDPEFLKEIANDPTSPRFDSSQPAGEFTAAPTAGDLQSVFQLVARKILVRISV
jgi:hypothetical protein